MKNFTNNFKQFTSRLSARWLLMALMMLVGTSSAWAATQRYIYVGLSNNYHNWKTAGEWGINQWGGTNGGVISGSSIEDLETTITYSNCTFHMYRMYIYDDNKNFEFKGNNNWWDCKKDGDKVSISGTTNNAILFQDNDGGDGGSPTFHQTDYQETSTASLAASATPVNTNTNVTLTPSLSSNATYNEIKSTSYSINPSTGASISGNTFKATVAGTYTVTATVTYNPKYFTDITKTATATTTIEVTNPYTYPAVSTISATVDGDNLVCEGKITSMGSASTVVWAFTVLSNDNISKATTDWKYPNNQNRITVANTTFTYNIPISSLSLTEGNRYYVRAMAVDLGNLGISNNQYGNAVAGDAISFVYDPCTELPNDAYALSSISAEWTGSDITPTISKKDENYPTPTITYNEGSALPNKPGEYTIKATVSGDATYCNKEFDLGTFTITCPTIAAPAITTPDPVCAGTPVTLSSYNGDNTNTVKWYSSQEFNSEVTEQVTLPDDGTVYYAKAYHEASGCYSSEYSTLTFNVNPLPTISISGSEEAVLYEDVELTAATDGTSISWEITEGDGSLSSTTGNSVTLTSSSAGNVTVTATATSTVGCTSAATKTVIFSAEDCNGTTSADLIITCDPGSYTGDLYCYIFGATTPYGWSSCKGTKTNGIWEWEFNNINEGDHSLIFHSNSKSDGKDCKTSDLNHQLQRGYQYDYVLNGVNSNWCNEPHPTIDAVSGKKLQTITAPAAKTISVSTTDGEGNIIFSGQVVKTGCDATNEYGFQYSSDEQTWTTVKVGENAAAGTVISNNTVTGLDGTYYVRAYITNDNSTQYGAVTEITVSTKKYPITRVTLTHVKNQAGEPYSEQELENLIYCVGDIVWFKLEQDGSNFQYYEWISYPGTGLEGMYYGGMFKLKITRSGNVGIRLRNEANVDGEGNPTWVESDPLGFNTHPEPTAPTISFATATICSNDAVGATLTLGATVSGQAYELWKYANDDDTEGSKVANVATLNCTENNQELQFTGIKTAGKYFVKTYYTEFCNTVTANSSYATLTVVNAEDVSISITPATATTTPWMPVKLTISATDDYTLEVPEGVEFSQNGDICSVKIPLPDGATGGEGQYENVSFPQNATTSYTVTANLVSIGGEDNPCAVPATATITLTPYVEECTIGH